MVRRVHLTAAGLPVTARMTLPFSLTQSVQEIDHLFAGLE
jgi:hypothetical protein